MIHSHPKHISILSTIPSYLSFKSHLIQRYTQISYLRPLNELITEQEIHLLDQKVRLVKNKTTESGEHCPKTDLDYQKDIRELIHEKKSLIYLSTQEAVHKKWPFESLIKRSYFHVKALDDDQLDNWRNVDYLTILFHNLNLIVSFLLYSTLFSSLPLKVP